MAELDDLYATLEVTAGTVDRTTEALRAAVSGALADMAAVRDAALSELWNIRAAALAAGPLSPPDGLQLRNVALATAAYPPAIEVGWSELAPSLGTLNSAPIDKLLSTGKVFSLRPMLGRFAPAWLKDAAGTFRYTEPQSKTVVPDMVRWWEPIARVATLDLHARIAARFDGRLRLVWVNAAMSYYGEPMQRGLASPATCEALVDAGFTPEADIGAIADGYVAASLFRRTPVAQFFNPYQRLTPDGSGFTLDPITTAALMDRFRAACGPGAILANASLRSDYLPKISTANGGVYGQILARGKPFRFQTAMLALVGDLAAVLRWAADAGAHAVELPAGYPTVLSEPQLASFNAVLKANSPGSGVATNA